MTHLVNSIQDQVHRSYQSAEKVVSSLKKGINQHIHTAKNQMNHVCQFARQNCEQTAVKAKEFINRHRETIFFVGCSAFTASLAPQIFIPVALATMIVRMELSRHAKKSFPDYFRDETRIYKMQAQYRSSHITSADVIVAAAAAVVMAPVIGGMAAGNCAAKWAMDFYGY